MVESTGLQGVYYRTLGAGEPRRPSINPIVLVQARTRVLDVLRWGFLLATRSGLSPHCHPVQAGRQRPKLGRAVAPTWEIWSVYLLMADGTKQIAHDDKLYIAVCRAKEWNRLVRRIVSSDFVRARAPRVIAVLDDTGKILTKIPLDSCVEKREGS